MTHAFLHFFRLKTKLSEEHQHLLVLCCVRKYLNLFERLVHVSDLQKISLQKEILIASELFLIVQFLLYLNAILIQSGVIVVVVAAVACLINNTTLAFISS